MEIMNTNNQVNLTEISIQKHKSYSHAKNYQTISTSCQKTKNKSRYKVNNGDIITIDKPIYQITMPPIASSQKILLQKRQLHDTSRLFSLYKPKVKRDILRETINTRSLASLFNRIKNSELERELMQLTSYEYVQKNTLQASKPYDNRFVKKEITLVPLKGVTFKFENPVQKAKMSRYLYDFSKITILGRNVES